MDIEGDNSQFLSSTANFISKPKNMCEFPMLSILSNLIFHALRFALSFNLLFCELPGPFSIMLRLRQNCVLWDERKGEGEREGKQIAFELQGRGVHKWSYSRNPKYHIVSLTRKMMKIT